MENSNPDNNQPAVLRYSTEEKIRAAILQGVLKPGERIIESKISEQLGISRTPIREVLSALEQEGLVTSQPRRGYFVVDFNEKDILEIYSFRILLEKNAIQRAISSMENEHYDYLQQMIGNMEQTESQSDGIGLLAQYDLAFHDTFFQLAHHKRLQNAWLAIKSQTMILMGITSKTHITQPRQPHQIHHELLYQISQKKMGKIEEVLVFHIEDAKQRALAALQLRQNMG
jgi:DNA-binding GntR family transcriptional regulator